MDIDHTVSVDHPTAASHKSHQ
ncbi:ORF-8 [Porcine circovirus type 2-E]|uniref:ORF8 n=4 Tax=Porcine circovirus 2 TaxID=85708 RepID=O56126_PCV2|nr:ORF8 [Porcine circovirus 2]AAD03078.1 ORF-8 [Porcine circovirus type 2-E]AAD03094.1 ORF-8 [Porcine circovirus type 2-B]AAD11935.1 ORF-8 [Bovine circovirus]AAC35314.1 ORF8 [Porcine circovirus 2]